MQERLQKLADELNADTELVFMGNRQAKATLCLRDGKLNLLITTNQKLPNAVYFVYRPYILDVILSRIDENELMYYLKGNSTMPSAVKLNKDIDELYLPLCTTYQLRLRGIDKIGHLVQFTDSEILSLPNIGMGRLKEIMNQLEKMDLRLGMTDKDGIDFSGYTATRRG